MLSIGQTPLVRLHNLDKNLKAQVWAKVEGRNPGYSIKDRVAASIIWDGEKSGRLKPGMNILEATSGNTGIGLAMAAAARGYECTLVMQEGMSEERIRVLKMFGAELKLTDPELGMQGAVDAAQAMEAKEPQKYFYARQFENPANPQIHVETTGPEIEAALEGIPEIIVAGVGTGGTISGLAEYFKNKRQAKTWAVAVEPKSLPAIQKHLDKKVLEPAGHLIQGIGAGFIPQNLNLALVDQVIGITDREAFQTARALARREGLLCGISSGAAAAAALQLAALDEHAGKNIVVILPDGGDRYVSTELFGSLFEEKKEL